MSERELLALALRELAVRGGGEVARRIRYYEGNHDLPPASESWKRTWAERLRGLIDNQVALVVETRASAVMPALVEAVDDDKLAAAVALAVTQIFEENADTLAEVARHAEAAGTQAALAIDWNSEGQPDLYALDTRTCYVHRDRGGAYLGAVWLWKDGATPDAHTEATIYLPNETAHYRATTTNVLPAAADFVEVDRAPNPFGEVMVAVVDKRGSLIDRCRPHNDALNQSMQTEFVVGENYASPFRAWLGFDTYDPSTGEQTQAVPGINPATGGRDVSIPAVADSDGEKREVIQFESPDPERYLRKQEQERAAIARLAYIPAFMLQVAGSQPASGEALEIAYRPHLDRARDDWRSHYRQFWERTARLVARLWLARATGRPVAAPALRVVQTPIDTATAKSRWESVATAVSAGMTLEDALVEAYRMDREAAQLIAQRAEEQASRAADRQRAVFEGGLDLTEA